MHTRRIATFLLGAWIAGSLWIAFLEIQSSRSPGLVMNRPIAPAAKLIETLGPEQVRLLLRHLAFEQTRYFSRLWEQLEVGLALALGVCLFRATQKRAFPLFLCAVMLALVLFQHLALTPELAFQGRETDFPPGNTALGPMARVWALQQVYAGAEVVKLITGAGLAGYLFVFRAPRRNRKEDDALQR